MSDHTEARRVLAWLNRALTVTPACKASVPDLIERLDTTEAAALAALRHLQAQRRAWPAWSGDDPRVGWWCLCDSPYSPGDASWLFEDGALLPPPLNEQLHLLDMRSKLADAKHRAVGAFGEQIARIKLSHAGYYVVTTQPGDGRPCDLVAIDTATGEKILVEVKTARQTTDKKWRFRLRNGKHTDHRQADVVLALVALRTGVVVPYVIPVGVVRDQTNLVISQPPDSYTGKYAQYRQSIECLNLEVNSCPA